MQTNAKDTFCIWMNMYYICADLWWQMMLYFAPPVVQKQNNKNQKAGWDTQWCIQGIAESATVDKWESYVCKL